MFTRKRFNLTALLLVLIAISISMAACTQPAVTVSTVTSTTPEANSTPPLTTTLPPDTGTTPTKTPLSTPEAASDDLSFLIGDDPATIDNSKLPITPLDKIHTTGSPADYDINTYRLVIDGNVTTPLSLTYDEIKALPSVTEVVLLICPGIFADNAEWRGVPVTAILDKVGLGEKAYGIVFYDGTQYQKSFFIKDVAREGVFLAYEVNGQPLPKEHGFPLRLVVKGDYGNTWVKWIDRIEIK